MIWGLQNFCFFFLPSNSHWKSWALLVQKVSRQTHGRGRGAREGARAQVPGSQKATVREKLREAVLGGVCPSTPPLPP